MNFCALLLTIAVTMIGVDATLLVPDMNKVFVNVQGKETSICVFDSDRFVTISGTLMVRILTEEFEKFIGQPYDEPMKVYFEVENSGGKTRVELKGSHNVYVYMNYYGTFPSDGPFQLFDESGHRSITAVGMARFDYKSIKFVQVAACSIITGTKQPFYLTKKNDVWLRLPECYQEENPHKYYRFDFS